MSLSSTALRSPRNLSYSLASAMALVTSPNPIPGLHYQPTLSDLVDSTNAYVPRLGVNSVACDR